jgi:hypothetical protein
VTLSETRFTTETLHLSRKCFRFVTASTGNGDFLYSFCCVAVEHDSLRVVTNRNAISIAGRMFSASPGAVEPFHKDRMPTDTGNNMACNQNLTTKREINYFRLCSPVTLLLVSVNCDCCGKWFHWTIELGDSENISLAVEVAFLSITTLEKNYLRFWPLAMSLPVSSDRRRIRVGKSVFIYFIGVLALPVDIAKNRKYLYIRSKAYFLIDLPLTSVLWTHQNRTDRPKTVYFSKTPLGVRYTFRSVRTSQYSVHARKVSHYTSKPWGLELIIYKVYCGRWAAMRTELVAHNAIPSVRV